MSETYVAERRTCVWWLCVGLALAGACTSRTLPLPPPEVSLVTSPSGGNVTVSGYALESASVGLVNDRTQAGAIVSTGSRCNPVCPFKAVVAAEPGDTLRVWQFFETEGAKEVQVPSH
ncbi:MAG TPA: hypothetical protein VF331_08930 [Polyangiales bacterium]